MLLIDLFIQSSLSFLSDVKKDVFHNFMSCSSFQSKKTNLSLLLVAQHLGTGKTHSINFPITYRLCKGKGGVDFAHQRFHQYLQSGGHRNTFKSAEFGITHYGKSSARFHLKSLLYFLIWVGAFTCSLYYSSGPLAHLKYFTLNIAKSLNRPQQILFWAVQSRG